MPYLAQAHHMKAKLKLDVGCDEPELPSLGEAWAREGRLKLDSSEEERKKGPNILMVH